MSLRGVKPAAVQKRLKAFFYGGPGAGKTMAAISFPSPYLIDTEKGSENDQYAKILHERGGAVFHTADFEEMMAEIRSLISEKHTYRTLVIDPLTIVYNDLVDKSAEKLRKTSTDRNATGTEFGRHYGEANKQMKHMLNLLLRLDMNVIITSHAKKEYGDDMKVIGTTFDCYKKLDYLFDLVFEVQKRGKEHVGVVRKSRIEAFPDGDSFPFNYAEIARKYGQEILERDSIAQQLASTEQVRETERLVELLQIPEETVQKWLSKALSESFAEMPAEAIQKCIEWMNSKIKGEEAA